MMRNGASRGAGSPSGKRALALAAALIVTVGLVMIVFEPWEKEPAPAASGAFEQTWGKDVDSAASGDGFEICTIAADCKAGAPTTGLGGEFSNPNDVALDGDGNVYVADASNGRIQKFDAAGNFERTWGRNVIQEGKPNDTAEDRFEICTVAADCRGGEGGGLGGEFSSPQGVATDASGFVYVTDIGGNHRVQKFDFSGNFERAWGRNVIQSGKPGDLGDEFEVCTSAGDCLGAFAGPLGGELNLASGSVPAVDAAGNVYVSDRSNHRIQKFTSAGVFQRAWGHDVIQLGAPGDGGDVFEICTSPANCQAGDNTTAEGGALNFPMGIDTDSASVWTISAGRIERYDLLGTWQQTWGLDVIKNGAPADTGLGFEVCTVADDCQTGSPGGVGGGMDGAEGLAVDGSGTVYVGDTDHARIQRFDYVGNWLGAWGRDVVQGGGTGFEICTVAAQCKVGVVGTLGGELSDVAPAMGVAVDAAGALYAADGGNHRIQVFKDVPATSPTTPPTASVPAGQAPTPTGQRAAALKKCKKKKTAKARKKCKKKAKKLPL